LPVFIKEDYGGVNLKSPYHTGKLENGWPLTAGRREWVLHLSTVGQALSAEKSSVLEASRRYSCLPLDKVKDWVLDWKADPQIIYPRLFVEPGKLAETRARMLKEPRWSEKLKAGRAPLAVACTILQDPALGKELVWRGQDDDPNSHNIGSLRSLRQYVRMLLKAGYPGERWGTTAPNNGRPMTEMVKCDAALGVAGLDAATLTVVGEDIAVTTRQDGQTVQVTLPDGRQREVVGRSP